MQIFSYIYKGVRERGRGVLGGGVGKEENNKKLKKKHGCKKLNKSEY